MSKKRKRHLKILCAKAAAKKKSKTKKLSSLVNLFCLTYAVCALQKYAL